jgi:hypothetical protein
MRTSVQSASLAFVLLAGAASVVGCPKPQATQDTVDAAPRAPEAIPTDFVVNDFLPVGDASNGGAVGAVGDGGADMAGQMPPAAGSAPPAHANLKLLDPGADPKVKRRYDVKVGKTDTLKVTLQTTLTREQGGQKGSMPQPPMIFTLAVTAKAKAPDGTTTFDLKLVKADLGPMASSPNDPPQLAQMNKQMAGALKALAGTTGSFQVDPRGSLGAFALNGTGGAAAMGAEAAAEIAPLIQQALEGMMVEFPDEAVGKGAHWVEQTMSAAEGVQTAVTMDSTLTDVAGDDLTVTVKTTRNAPAQQVPDPRAPKGTMLAVDGSANAVIHTHLDHLVKKAQGDANTHVTVKEPGSPGGPGGQPPQMPQTSQQTIAVKQSVEAS